MHSRFSLSRYQKFKDFEARILVATNLFGRGMDIERVNIVFNYDMPEDSDTYLHRVSFQVLNRRGQPSTMTFVIGGPRGTFRNERIGDHVR